MSAMTPEQIQQLQFNARNQLQSLSPCLSCDQAPKLDDIEMLAVVGSGSFGKVYLVQDDEEELLAMKVIEKKTVERPDHCTSERRVLASVRFPFIGTIRNIWLLISFKLINLMITH